MGSIRAAWRVGEHFSGHIKPMNHFKLTERDIAILRFINTFGFCEMPKLDQRFGWVKPRNYQIIHRLLESGLLKHERIFYGRHGIYRVTAKGARLTELPPLARIPLATYYHDLTLIDVYLQLKTLYPNATWTSTRELMRDKHMGGVGKRGHLPDGILIQADGTHIAIEVELTLKGKYRLESILKGYGGAFDYKEVWYYCSDSVAASMRPMVAKMPFIKIHLLKELLHGRSSQTCSL